MIHLYFIIIILLSYIFYNFFTTYTIQNILKLKKYALQLSIILFLYSIFMWIFYDPYQLNNQFILHLDFFLNTFYFSIDSISLLFIILTTFLIPFCILFGWHNIYSYYKEYLICLFSIEIILLFVFSIMDIFLFYIFFESILIPMFILIGIWGSRKRKIHAAYLLFFYTLIGSFFMLISIILIYSYTSTTNIFIIYNTKFPFYREYLIWFFLFLSFSIKIPMFPFHIWLPEAHVEAPTEGSVILAGLLLKLGSYGFIRILIPFSIAKTFYFLPFIFLISSLGIIYTSFTTLRQIDLKRIIAYSSIAHMNIAILGLFSMNINSINGSILLMIGHGLVSSSLFFMIGILYDRFKTRIVQYYSGLVYNAPILITLFFFIIISNFSFPGSINFISEFLIILGILENYNLYLFFIISIGIILCTLYSILLYNKVSFGLVTNYNIFINDLTRIEFFLFIPFILFIYGLGLYPNHLIQLTESTIHYNLLK